MPLPISDRESGASVRAKLNQAFTDLAALAGAEPYAAVATFANLPATPADGTTYIVSQPSGVYFINRKPAGFYRYSGGAWVYLGEVPDSYFTDETMVFSDNTDPTKKAKLELSGVTAGATRTLTVPDADGVIALLSEVLAAQSRANHTGTQLAATISDFTAAVAAAAATGPQGISGEGAPTSVSLSADQAFSVATLADVTNMPTLALDANTDYKIELIGSFTSAATTTGIGLCLNVGGTVTRIAGQASHPVSATTQGACGQEVNNAVTGATTGVRSAGAAVVIYGVWHVRMGATGGNAQLRCRSEVASSAVTLQAGMRMRAFAL